MATLARSTPPAAGRGFTALETALVFITASVVGAIVTFALLGLNNRATDDGAVIAHRAVNEAAGPLSLRGGVLTTRGSVDIDGDNVINLNGNDRQAVVKLQFVVGPSGSGIPVDLTPPYTVNSTQADPDASGLEYTTLFSFTSQDHQVSDAVWTVTFPGTDNGDYFLDLDERAEITLWLHPYDNANAHYDVGSGSSDAYIDGSSSLLLANRPFTVEGIVSGSSVLHIQRSLPIELSASDMLE